MSCPTCDGTMQQFAVGVYWCPRCGTLGKMDTLPTPAYVPKLVERCRELRVKVESGYPFLTQWYMLGIAESINTLPQ